MALMRKNIAGQYLMYTVLNIAYKPYTLEGSLEDTP